MPSRGAARRVALGVLIRAFPIRTALLASGAAASGILPALFAYQIGQLVGSVESGTLVAIGLILLAQEVVPSIRSLISTDLYRRFDEYLMARVMRITLGVPRLDLFDDPEMAARTDRAVRIARYGPGELVSGLSYRWTSQVQGLASAALVATVSPVAAVLLLTLWTVVGWFLRADFHRANPFWAEPLRRAMYLHRLALAPDAAKELRIFGLADWLADRFGREWAAVMADLWRSRSTGYRTMAVLTPLIVAVNLAVLGWAVHAALAGDITAGATAVLVQGVFGMAALAAQDGDIWIENGAIPVPDVLELERRAPIAISPGIRSADQHPRESIHFADVGFAYPGRDPVYEKLNLTIHSGQSLAIVGLNGAGKTTLIKLLTGLAVPQHGEITVDGIPLEEFDMASWRHRIAAIFQDFTRYPMSARDNIAFGSVEKGQSVDVEAAAARAGATEVLAGLPQGADTVLSRRHSGGVDLSGGQWQRIALARAMAAVAAGAQVLVLDEPSAHLDVRAEADLYDRFLDITHGLTSIVISHRFSTVRRADRIVVLERGRIVEDGNHDELVAAAGRYAELFRIQAERYHAR